MAAAAYGNHPSFLLCAIGNEFGHQSTDWDLVNTLVEEIKTLDPRRLYAGCGACKNLAADDYWFTHHIGTSTRGVGPAHTDWDFSQAAEASPVPLIAHETGQRPVFPNYDTLLPKFTGPLLPLNLERYRHALVTNGLENSHAARTGFESVYWSAGWWGNKFSSLGVLCDPQHTALEESPNDGWSDWQWHDLCAGATTFDLTGAPPGFRPIMQSVPDFHYNTLLGQVFEARVGSGSLLVCGYDLTRHLDERPAARQFRRSLFRYAGSNAFRPTTELPPTWIETHYRIAGLARRGATVVHASSEDLAHGNVAANMLYLPGSRQREITWSPPPRESQSGAYRPPVPPH